MLHYLTCLVSSGEALKVRFCYWYVELVSPSLPYDRSVEVGSIGTTSEIVKFASNVSDASDTKWQHDAVCCINGNE